MLHWRDELSEDEVPAENIWHHSERLEEWFAGVKQRRETGHKSTGSEPEDAPMSGNALVDEMLGDRRGE